MPSAKTAAKTAKTVVPVPVLDDLPPSSLLRQPRKPTLAQPAHRFRVGDKLLLAAGGRTIVRVNAGCTVVALLPYEGHGSLLYRVRSEAEQFDRIVSEGDLSRG